MSFLKWTFLFLASILLSCKKPAGLPIDSPYNTVSQLNDSTWYGTGTAIRLLNPAQVATDVKQFSLQIRTDLPYVSNVSTSKSVAVTGCTSECVPTQRLHIYHIPLKKGKYKLSKLDKRRSVDFEKTHYMLLVNGSGLRRDYQVRGNSANWIRVTRYDRLSNTIEGQFRATLSDSANKTVQFRAGLFRVNVTDVKLK